MKHAPLLLALFVSLQACSRAPRPAVSPGEMTTGRDTTLDYLNRPPGNDSLAVMKALGEQIRKDYRGATLLFGRQPVCGDVHPTPCPSRGGSAQDIPSVVEVVMRAAGGTPACGPPPPSCPRPDQKAFVVEVSHPRIAKDSARVGVTAFYKVGDGKDAFLAFERYVYGMTRMSPYAWRATVRYLESTGAYEYNRPPDAGSLLITPSHSWSWKSFDSVRARSRVLGGRR
jgi:hypothetical protein